jgi:hypothetical protein
LADQCKFVIRRYNKGFLSYNETTKLLSYVVIRTRAEEKTINIHQLIDYKQRLLDFASCKKEVGAFAAIIIWRPYRSLEDESYTLSAERINTIITGFTDKFKLWHTRMGGNMLEYSKDINTTGLAQYQAAVNELNQESSDSDESNDESSD